MGTCEMQRVSYLDGTAVDSLKMTYIGFLLSENMSFR
jgi:hypothetical protein